MWPADKEIAISVAPLLPRSAFATKQACERASALQLLRRMTGNPDITITHSPAGAPLAEVFHISVSHCADAVAIALSRSCPVGIDIERPSERLERLVDRVSAPDEPTEAAPLRRWTAKEAVFKCAGVEGLVLSHIRLDLDALTAEIPGGRRFAVHHVEEGIALAVEI